MKIGYKVKEIGSDKSRPRVFFISHDADHDEYLDRVISMLHEQSDCMVYYRDMTEGPPKIDPGELSETLSEMQLVVIPVTQRLLREPSDAMSMVIPYALDHNIPVLPVLMEPDPAGRYSKLFGNLQYLDANDEDKTAEPFDKKLAAYLSEILISPETIQRVKDAFDACIFLSYRKKDRTMARELMRMIHRDPRYRDIAFWYDEFLVPGEDFNDGILRALEGADLFTMVVTPQLLEDPNYVMTHEYPAACEAGKTIFPVVMEDTDSSELERCYRGIPHAVTASDDETWQIELNDKLKNFALQTGKDDPHHMFLIGLAYLDGINMEVDADKARRLITEAADAGLEEAMRKLSVMYFRGKGVPKSIVTSTQWQERLNASLEERYRAEKTDELLDELYTEQNFLANRYYMLKEDRKTLPAAAYLRELAEEKVRRGLPGSRHDLAFCTTKLGTWFNALDDYYSTKKYYGNALEIYEELLEDEPSDKIRRESSLVYSFLGRMYYSRSMTEESLDCYRRAEEILLGICSDEYRKATTRNLMNLYKDHADVLIKAGNRNEAMEMYAKASEIADSVPAEKSDFKEKSALEHLYFRLDILYDDMGRKEEAREYVRKRLRILELQIGQARESGMRYAGLYNSKGWCHRRLSEAEEARRSYHMCLEAHEEDPDIPAVFEDHMDAYSNLANLESILGNKETAEGYRREELALARKLSERTGSRGHLERVAKCLEKMAGTDPDMLEEALYIRHKVYLIGRHRDCKMMKDALRRRIDDLYRERPELRRYRIALLRDSADEIEHEKQVLLDAGYVVIDQREYGGYQIHEIAEETVPDLMIVELGNPSGDVSEAIRAWKKQNWISSCRIPILITADASQAGCFDNGVNKENYRYMLRPYTDAEFLEAVKSSL